MRLLQKISIRRKQMLVILLTSVVAVLLACAGLVSFEIVSYRRELVWSLTSVAQIIGDNSSGALDFNDAKAAEDMLAALRVRPNIVSACIYTKDGTPFAKYVRDGDPANFSFPSPEADGYRFTNNRLTVSQGIEQKGDKIGSIYLESDLGRLTARLRSFALIAAGLVCVSMLAALILSSQLQRWISEPILHLAKMARTVALEKNYGLRVTKQSQDELGTLTDDFNAMLSQIQQQAAALKAANEGLERRVEERTRELESSLSLIHATVESTADGILVVNRQNKVVTYNQKFMTMWNIPEDVIASRDDDRLLGFVLDQLVDAEGFLSKVRELYAHPDTPSFDPLTFKDGRVFERYSQPQFVGTEIVGRVWNFRDITQRRRAETDLEKVHRQLVDASRHAGMAEVATNVLHNVGNVLNSVNVSTTVVADRLRKHPAANLSKLAALLREHEQNLSQFLTVDPKGKEVLGYLETLARHLNQEHEAMLEEMNSLANNVAHIKDIVAVQQSYSKMSGMTESLPVIDLVEDALRMNAAALARHDVRIVREYDGKPTVFVEKHKVLQILVNLIRNAKYALDEGRRPDKQLTVQVGQNGNGYVRVAVADNGVGILPQNLTRIFEHGFTTRKTGHGFGLHSGALAAKEMNGTLAVHSDGPGKGATFVLELPVETKEKSHE